MRILLDTNIIIAAAINPSGTPATLLNIVMAFHELVICEQTAVELKNFLKKKSSKKYPSVGIVFDMVEHNATIIRIPAESNESESMIRDETDRPILRAAISANVDIIITGDKDFLESGIDKPKILTARDFLDEFVS